MAANKFASMLQRRTNKMTVILVYALLEWVLIILLLLQALFSYLIIKFAECFGLKTPCLWCSRVDHIFEPGKKKKSYRDLLCESHAMEISNLGYCSNHHKLTELRDLCVDCSKSDDFYQIPRDFPFFVDDDDDDEKDESRFCSCCGGESLKNRLFSSPCILIKPTWNDLDDYTQKQNLIISEHEIVSQTDDFLEIHDSDGTRSEYVANHPEDVAGAGEVSMVSGVEETEKNSTCSVCGCGCKEMTGDLNFDRKEESAETETETETPPHQHLEFYIDRGDDRRLIPVDLIDFSADDVEKDGGNNQDVVLDFAQAREVEEDWEITILPQEVEESRRSSGSFADVQVAVTEENQSPMNDEHVEKLGELSVTVVTAGGELDSDLHQDDHVWNDEVEAEISIGTEIPDHEPIDEIQTRSDDEYDHTSNVVTQEVTSTSSPLMEIDNIQDSKEAAKDVVEFNIVLPNETRSETSNNNQIPSIPELNDDNEEDDKVPDTPTWMDSSLHLLHKKLLLLEAQKESGTTTTTTTEDSLDGSVTSEVEVGGVVTIEKMKTALRIERKALNDLYAELEEERSASAIAANQTMAMINRLQEEKASMQMEALQYQRMMEEQSEYDQEALQLLNELVVKREKEKMELEREIEIYRKKLQDYEAKEKIAFLRNSSTSIITMRSHRNSSVSCSNTDDSDGPHSIDFNNDVKKEKEDRDSSSSREIITNNNNNNNQQNTPVEAVLYLEETLANFEEERISILEELKMLEEKLFTLSDEQQQQQQHNDDYHPEQNGNGNGNGYYHNNSDYTTETNGFGNGKHYKERRSMNAKAKRLLPLFDDVVDSDMTEDSIPNGDHKQEHEVHEQAFDSIVVQKSLDEKYDSEFKQIAVEEEVEHVYERLQALEADREFLKHCIGSLRKGDKGLDLLQEILQHLRDLRNVDIQLKNIGDGIVQ